MLKIGLVACAKRKKNVLEKAENLYISPYFKKAKQYVKSHYDKWYILSAKHHLVLPESLIEPYDETLNKKSAAEIDEWSLKVLSEIRVELPDPETCLLFFHCGVRYRKRLIPLLLRAGYNCRIPLQGFGIGQQLAWYNHQNRKESYST